MTVLIDQLDHKGQAGQYNLRSGHWKLCMNPEKMFCCASLSKTQIERINMWKQRL